MSRVRKFELRAVWKELKNKATGATTSHTFYYPARGFGQIAEKIQERFIDNGGEILFESSVKRLELKNDSEIEAIHVETGGESRRLSAKLLISTAPIDVLHQLVCSALGGGETAELGLSWRSLRILYLFTPDKIPSVQETYYFPEPDVIFGRVSEPAKYSPFLHQVEERTALVIEIPCTFGDEIPPSIILSQVVHGFAGLIAFSDHCRWNTGACEHWPAKGDVCGMSCLRSMASRTWISTKFMKESRFAAGSGT